MELLGIEEKGLFLLTNSSVCVLFGYGCLCTQTQGCNYILLLYMEFH